MNMSLAIFIPEFLFYLVAMLNVGLAIWSTIEWGLCYKINHTKYRLLYLAWILISLAFCGLYLGITFSTTPGNILEAPWYMISIRPAITAVLAVSAVTAEMMRFLRRRSVVSYDHK